MEHKYLVFKNAGEIDMLAAVTNGVSVKSEGAIGFFGTGMKFGMATVLRLGGKVRIWSGANQYVVNTETVDIRGQSFELVLVNGERTGFTTMLGRTWEPWMAFREFACNALDEGGSYILSDTETIGVAGETIVEIDSPEMIEAYHARHEIIIENTPLYVTPELEIYPGPSTHIYYRKVRVGKLARATKYRYNILSHIDLTEDRIYKWSFQIADAITLGLGQVEDRSILEDVLQAGDNYLEHDLTFIDNGSVKDTFHKVAANLRANLTDVVKSNPSALEIARQRKLVTLGPQVSIDLTDVENTSLADAKSFLIDAGYSIEDFPITVVEDLGNGILGLASEGRIFIAREAIRKGRQEIASTLLEEWVHLTTGYADRTRLLQSWLFDEVISQASQRLGVAL